MSKTEKDYYVCYYSLDQKADEKWPWVSYQLEQAGFSISIRPWDDLPGDDFLTKIKLASQYCNNIIVLVSDGSLKVMIPNDDIKTKFIMGVTGLEDNLIIVRIDNSNINRLFEKFNLIDLNTSNEKEALTRLLSGISKKLNKPEKISPPIWSYQDKYTLHYTDLTQVANSEILSIRQNDLNNFLHHNLLQQNYHMRLELEIETKKEVEVKNETTGQIEKKEQTVWEKTDLQTVLSDSRSYLLVNPSGMGKTIFSYFIGGELLKHQKRYPYLPLPLTCLALNFRQPGESIRDFCNRAMEDFYDNSCSNLINSDWRNLCFIFDALDQSQNIDEIILSLNSQSREATYQHAKIILTSRENTAHLIPPEFQRIRLMLPDGPEIQRYLGDQYQKLEPLIRSTGELVTVPILLEMLHTLAVSGRLQSHIHNRAELYHQFIQHLINREREKPCFSKETTFFSNPSEVENLLERIAFMSLQNNEILEIQKENLTVYGINESPKNALLRLGLLIELFEDQTTKLIFRHQSFQAYLAARFIYHEDQDIFRQLVRDISSFYNDVWQEVIRFYLGLERDPDRITVNIDLICNSNNPMEKTDLFKSLRLIQAAILISETYTLPLNLVEVLNLLLENLLEVKGYLNIFVLTLDRFNSANHEYRIQLIDFVLQPLLRDKYSDVRLMAVEALIKIVTINEIPLLQPLLRDKNQYIRQAAVEALGKIGTVNEIPLLQPLGYPASGCGSDR
jgi:hypothetical protein